MDEDHNTPVRIIKKKARGHGGHHGGAWKVAYADFVTAMMALFIVLWIVGQSNAVKQAISAYFKDPGVFTSGRDGGILPDGQKADPLKVDPMSKPPPVSFDNLAAEMAKLKTEAGSIEKAISATPDFSKFKDKIQVMVTPDGLRIDLVEASEGLFFDIGKATIKPETIQLLRVIAGRISTLQNAVIIEGYTDGRPYVSPGYSNWDLSTERANSARRVLEENGLRERQIVEVRGFADRKLKMPEKPLDYSNRRVSILVIPSKPGQQKVSGPGVVEAPLQAVRPPQASPSPGRVAQPPGERKL